MIDQNYFIKAEDFAHQKDGISVIGRKCSIGDISSITHWNGLVLPVHIDNRQITVPLLHLAHNAFLFTIGNQNFVNFSIF